MRFVSTTCLRPTIAAALAAMSSALLSSACLPDNPSLDLDAGDTSDESSDTDTGGPERVEDGPLGCPIDEACTIVAVSQTIDDRVDLFTAAGPGPSYRGAIDLDLKLNPNGDISGENLDEPYGLAWDGAALHVLLGHYPMRDVGSLLRFPAASLAGVEVGSTIPTTAWFEGGTSTTLGVDLTLLDRTEPLSMILHPGSGALLVASFANDLLLPDVAWTVGSELLRVGPGPAPQPEAMALDCAGAWSIVALDDDADAVALACDGDEAVVIVDVDASGTPSPRCVADIVVNDKRVRYLAADGLGGVIAGESPPVVSANEDARLWWFDGDCQTRGFSALDGSTSWELRAVTRVPNPLGPRWLLARSDAADPSVVVLAGDPSEGSVSVCGRVDALDDADAWTAVGGIAPLRPHALALSSDGFGLAVGVGPVDYDSAGPGYGSVWWVEGDDTEDPCDRGTTTIVELGAAAPGVDVQLPETWRRAPDVVEILEVLP